MILREKKVVARTRRKISTLFFLITSSLS